MHLSRWGRWASQPEYLYIFHSPGCLGSSPSPLCTGIPLCGTGQLSTRLAQPLASYTRSLGPPSQPEELRSGRGRPLSACPNPFFSPWASHRPVSTTIWTRRWWADWRASRQQEFMAPPTALLTSVLFPCGRCCRLLTLNFSGSEWTAHPLRKNMLTGL